MKSKNFLDKCVDFLVGGHKYAKAYNLCAEAVSLTMVSSIFDYEKATYYLGLAELYHKNLDAISRKYSIKTKGVVKELKELEQDITDCCEILECRQKTWLV